MNFFRQGLFVNFDKISSSLNLASKKLKKVELKLYITFFEYDIFYLYRFFYKLQYIYIFYYRPKIFLPEKFSSVFSYTSEQTNSDENSL